MTNEQKNAQAYRQLRKSIGTQDKVARCLGVNRATLSYRENSQKPLRDEFFLALKSIETKKNR